MDAVLAAQFINPKPDRARAFKAEKPTVTCFPETGPFRAGSFQFWCLLGEGGFHDENKVHGGVDHLHIASDERRNVSCRSLSEGWNSRDHGLQLRKKYAGLMHSEMKRLVADLSLGKR